MSQDKLLYMLPKITHSRFYAIVISNIKTIIVICHVFFITFVKFISFTCIHTQIYTNCFIALLLPYPLRFLLTYPNIDILGQWLDSKIIQNGDCKMATSLHQSGGFTLGKWQYPLSLPQPGYSWAQAQAIQNGTIRHSFPLLVQVVSDFYLGSLGFFTRKT